MVGFECTCLQLVKSKMDDLEAIIFLTMTSIFEWYVVGVAPRMDTKHMCVLNK